MLLFFFFLSPQPAFWALLLTFTHFVPILSIQMTRTIFLKLLNSVFVYHFLEFKRENMLTYQIQGPSMSVFYLYTKENFMGNLFENTLVIFNSFLVTYYLYI